MEPTATGVSPLRVAPEHRGLDVAHGKRMEETVWEAEPSARRKRCCSSRCAAAPSRISFLMRLRTCGSARRSPTASPNWLFIPPGMTRDIAPESSTTEAQVARYPLRFTFSLSSGGRGATKFAARMCRRALVF